MVPQPWRPPWEFAVSPGRPVTEILIDYLQSKHMLLVLDNCEHVIETCAQLTNTLLRACPSVCILATSRAALNIRRRNGVAGAVTFPPDPTVLPPVDQLLGYEAVRLFVERATAVLPRSPSRTGTDPAVPRSAGGWTACP